MTLQGHHCTACGGSHGDVSLAVTLYIFIRAFLSKSINILRTKSFLTGETLPLKRHAVSLPLNDKCQFSCMPLNPLLQEWVKFLYNINGNCLSMLAVICFKCLSLSSSGSRSIITLGGTTGSYRCVLSVTIMEMTTTPGNGSFENNNGNS